MSRTNLAPAMFAGIALVLIAALPAQSQQSSVTVTTDPTGAVTQTQTTSLSGPSAVSAQAAAETAQITAATTAIPGSGLTPTTTAGTGAGTAETALLELVATRAAADHIVNTICTSVGCAKTSQVIILDAGAPTPDTSAWVTFKSRGAHLKDLLTGDQNTLLKLNLAFANDAKQCGGNSRAPSDKFAFVPAVALIALAPKIASYFYTNYQISGVTVTPDDYFMEVALLSASPKWKIAGQLPYSNVSLDISSVTDDVDSAVKTLSDTLNTSAAYQAYLANCPTNATAHKGQAAVLSASIASATTDVANANAFLAATVGGATTASSGTTASPGTLTPIVSGYQIATALAPGGPGVLYVKVESVSGGVIMKTNLWTNLGAMPMYNSATMLVSYVYYPAAPKAGADAQPSAGAFAIVTPYHKASELPRLMTIYNAGACQTPNAAYPDSAAYCPQVY